jgi:hypothetical protein
MIGMMTGTGMMIVTETGQDSDNSTTISKVPLQAGLFYWIVYCHNLI